MLIVVDVGDVDWVCDVNLSNEHAVSCRSSSLRNRKELRNKTFVAVLNRDNCHYSSAGRQKYYVFFLVLILVLIKIVV